MTHANTRRIRGCVDSLAVVGVLPSMLVACSEQPDHAASPRADAGFAVKGTDDQSVEGEEPSGPVTAPAPTPPNPHQNGTPTMTSPTTTRSRWAVAAAALLLAPAVLTACSSGGSHGGDGTPSPKADGGATLFSCMRDKGYDMPDPKAGERGITLEKPDGVDQEQFDADFSSCASTGVGAGTSGKAVTVDPNDPEWKKTVSCVRGLGFEDFPDDPNALTTYQPADPAALDDAMKTCSASAGSTGGE